MEEVIVEGLDYEDFVSLKTILTECTVFNTNQGQHLADNTILIENEQLIKIKFELLAIKF